MMYHYLFGPVPSRRLGLSLGIDLLPAKTCSMNCVYCECGATTDLTLEHKSYFPTSAIMNELRHFLAAKPQLDYLTFSGSGEPTLHAGIGEIIQFLQQDFPAYKIALLTNASLFHLAAVRTAVQAVDLILPSLDAASESYFQQINRPVAGLTAAMIIEGLTQLRQIQRGEMWLEILFVPGLNDQPAEIQLLRQAIHRIRPTLVQLNTLDRPGAEAWVQPVPLAQLQQIAQQLDWPTEIIARVSSRQVSAPLTRDLENRILQMLKRRPCTLTDLVATLGLPAPEIEIYLKELLRQRQIEREPQTRGIFYKWCEN